VVEQNPAMKTMRSVSLAALQSAFRPGQRVIEIGCGTGVEAVALAEHGVYVLATDLSSQMLERAGRRVTAAGSEERVHNQGS
jgi:cyclopropane fatty-acyl-phospholipid synthase-like methyltransferase